ncbi:MAG: ACT domain-containing protein [Anaerolineales bacterium]|nr:ACT domain-containing protein [Anaerolineales bacterium]
MNGETNLGRLLVSMQPELVNGEYVFCTLPETTPPGADLQPVGWFREAEGVTLILPRSSAEEAGLEFAFVSRMITLKVHSSLEAVGFLAVITERLARAGISVNAVSAYYHDHIFIPVDRAEETLELLKEITGNK